MADDDLLVIIFTHKYQIPELNSLLELFIVTRHQVCVEGETQTWCSITISLPSLFICPEPDLWILTLATNDSDIGLL